MKLVKKRNSFGLFFEKINIFEGNYYFLADYKTLINQIYLPDQPIFVRKLKGSQITT